MGDETRRILLVGHCMPDEFAMKAALGRFAPGAEFVSVNDETTLAANENASAMLVNRVLDGDFRATTGVELIRSLPEAVRRRAILISNIPGAQSEAEAAGASPGFGKTELYSDRARAAMLRVLGE